MRILNLSNGDGMIILGYSHYYLIVNVFKELNYRGVHRIHKDINTFAIYNT